MIVLFLLLLLTSRRAGRGGVGGFRRTMAATTIRAIAVRSSVAALTREYGGRVRVGSQAHASRRVGSLLLGELGRRNRSGHCVRSTKTSTEEEEVVLQDREEKAVLAEMTEFIREDSENLFNDRVCAQTMRAEARWQYALIHAKGALL